MEAKRRCKNYKGTGKVTGGSLTAKCLYCLGTGTVDHSLDISTSNKIINKCQFNTKVKLYKA